MKKVIAAVKAIIQNEEDKILIVKQVIGNYIEWGLPGGKIESQL